MKTTFLITILFLIGIGPLQAQTIQKGWRLIENKKYTEALVFLQGKQQKMEKATPEKYGKFLYLLGKTYLMLDQYSEAEEYLLKAMPLQKNKSSVIVHVYVDLGLLYFNMHNYAEAEKCLMKAKSLGKKHPHYTEILDCFGYLYETMGNYVEAEKYLLEAKTIREKISGKKRPDYVMSLNNLGNIYHEMGNFVQAEKYYTEAKVIRENILGKKHPDYATSLNNLGLLYKDIGNYAQAEKYVLEAKAIREDILGKKHPNYAQSLNDLGVLYKGIGNYAQAEKYALEAKAIREDILGKKHPNYAQSLNNLGTLYCEIGNYAQAEKYLLEAKIIREDILGKKHPVYVNSLNNLGFLYNNIGNYTKAEEYYLESKTILEEVLGKEHPDYAISLNNLGLLYIGIGNYAQAEKYLLEAKTIWENVLGKEHLYYIGSLGNLSGLYLERKEYTQAQTLKLEADKIKKSQVENTFSFLSERQRDLFWDKSRYDFELSYSYVFAHTTNQMIAHAYDNTLFTKGLLLRTTNAIRDAIYSSGNSELIDRYEQLGNLRRQISDLQQKDNYSKELADTLQDKAEQIEKAVIQSPQAQAYRDLKADISMTWQDVQKQLKPDEAAIEFVHFRLFDKEWTARHLYAALLLRPELEAPAWIPLCEQEQLEEILRITTDDTQLQIENLYSHNGRKFYHAIWNPLKEALRDVKTVYYSPSGLLHKISFSAMPADGEDELLSDQYNLHLVSSTREIARLKKEAGAAFNQDTTIVYGGLVYSLALPDSDRPESGQNAAGLPNAELRGSLSAWEYLAGTKTETEQIVSCLRDRRLPYQYYTEEKGNEESFKHLSGTKAGIIHLATHGFFLPDIERKNEDYAVLRLGENRGKPFENPLLRSGLILSGANRQWLAKENIMRDGIEDGILTADEIAKLNLTKTKLVVLSACETGLGDIKNSEGVFGLQRAFKLAGVESLIMSLWKIPDEATAELMTLFYRQWLSGESKQKAFKTAQKKVREKYPSPFFWAASVLMD